MFNFLKRRRFRKLLAGADFEFAAEWLGEVFSGKIIPKELATVLDTYCETPCLDNAVHLVEFDPQLAVFFVESHFRRRMKGMYQHVENNVRLSRRLKTDNDSNG